MSYYKPSFSQTLAMSSRGGRGGGGGYGGSSRGGSYRGSSNRGGGGGWNDSRSSRGGFSSRGDSSSNRYSSSWSGGRGGSSSFDSRSRYPSSSAVGRYSSSGGGREESYKRPYRSDAPSGYSGRDNSGHRGGSPDRKRMRTEVQRERSPRAPSSRRSHEGGYGEYNSGRYESNSGGGYSGGGDRRVFSSERRPSSTFRSPRDDYRKPGMSSSPRGGGSFRGRAGTRGSLARRDAVLSRRRIAESYLSTRRPFPTGRTKELLRRIRLQKQRSAAIRRAQLSKRSKLSDKMSDKEDDDNWDDEEIVKKKDDDKADVSKEKSKTPTAESKTKKSPKRSSITPSKDIDMSDKDISDDDLPRSRYTGRPFIRLKCIHCSFLAVTFKDYGSHLYQSRHMSAMRRLALRQKATLAKMRLKQRNAQRELEKDKENCESNHTNFCLLCKLNYRQQKSTHQMSESHMEMKRFLMPYCKTCHIAFRSPMLFESHLCSLEHIKRKAKTDIVNGDKRKAEKSGSESGKENDVDGLNMDNFLILDSIGDEDDDGNVSDKSDKKEKKKHEAARESAKFSDEGSDESESKDGEKPITKHVRLVKVMYCDLCHAFVSPKGENPVDASDADDTEHYQYLKNRHCSTSNHLMNYKRYRRDRHKAKLVPKKKRRVSPKPVKEEKEEKVVEEEKKKTPEKESAEEKKVKKEETAKEATEEETGEDKLWADVDKDLGDILRDVEPGTKSSDEDDDVRGEGERYDRFRYSEKGSTKTTEERKSSEKVVEKKKTVDDKEDREEDSKTDKDDN